MGLIYEENGFTVELVRYRRKDYDAYRDSTLETEKIGIKFTSISADGEKEEMEKMFMIRVHGKEDGDTTQ